MYYIIELQTNGAQGANIVKTRESRNDAMSVYHTVLASAAISSVEHHACIVVDERGTRIAQECYDHPQAS